MSGRRSRSASVQVPLDGQIAIIPDFLKLTKLDDVDLLDYDLLRAIGSMCPNLKQVVFNAADNWGKHPYLLDFYNGSSENDPVMTDDSDDESEDRSSLMIALLNRWPKLETIEFGNIEASIYHKMVLKVFGPNLKNLIFRHSSTYPVVEDLSPCICLESLVFLDDCLLDIGSDPTHADTFLPMLKNFRSSCCLGSSWSSVFEQKNSLVSLDLHCCHIGIGDLDDESQASLDHQQPRKRLKLNEEVSEVWEELEILTIRQEAGLTPKLLNLLPQMRKLKKVFLSEGMRKTADTILLNCVIEKLSRRSPPVEIDFIWNYTDVCSLLKLKKQHFDTDED